MYKDCWDRLNAYQRRLKNILRLQFLNSNIKLLLGAVIKGKSRSNYFPFSLVNLIIVTFPRENIWLSHEANMPIRFQHASNPEIDKLVELCFLPPDELSDHTLVTPSLTGELEEETEFDYEEPESSLPLNAYPIIKAYSFQIPERLIEDLVVAVDSGIIHLGQLTGGGIAFAIRGAATCYSGKQILVLRYNTGALLLTPQNKARVFRFIGARLGKPDLYVTEKNGKLIPNPSAIDTINQIQDRCRSFVERMIQEEALALLSANHGGLLLVDGALAVSFDTPVDYLLGLIKTARNNRIDICAVSKKSRITIGGIPIDSLFEQYPTFVGYAPLSEVIKIERQAYEQLKIRSAEDITAGDEVFAVRFGFGPPGVTFRVDVARFLGHTPSDVINEVYEKCQIYGGYPRPLIDAHQYSCFQGGDKLNLLADLVVRTGLKVREEPSLSVIFQPFGAFGK